MIGSSYGMSAVQFVHARQQIPSVDHKVHYLDARWFSDSG
jgi:hypothetical protein